jgi:hypothetical protein
MGIGLCIGQREKFWGPEFLLHTQPRYVLQTETFSWVLGVGGWRGFAKGERCRDRANAQAGPLGWKDGTEALRWQSEASREWWWEDGCSDDRAGVCEPEPAEGGGEDGISVGVVCRAEHLQDVLWRLPGGVWDEWVRYPFTPVSGVPGGSGGRGSAGGGTGVVWVGRGG